MIMDRHNYHWVNGTGSWWNRLAEVESKTESAKTCLQDGTEKGKWKRLNIDEVDLGGIERRCGTEEKDRGGGGGIILYCKKEKEKKNASHAGQELIYGWKGGVDGRGD